MTTTRWSDTIALVDQATGDRRRFAKGSLEHRNLPLPLEWVRQAGMGHEGKVVVGVIDTLDTDGDGGKVLASGYFFDDQDPDLARIGEDIREAKTLASSGAIGPSVDLEPDMDISFVKKGTDEPLDFDALMELEEDEEVEILVTRARIMGATLVSGPAFEHASTDFQMEDEPDAEDDKGCDEGQHWDEEAGECVDDSPESGDDNSAGADKAAANALVASVIGSTSLPVGDRDAAWSGSGAAGRMFDAATGEGGKVNVSQVSRGFLYRDPDADPQTKAAYKLPFADIVNGTLTIIPKGVAATAGGRGVGSASIPAAEKATIRNKICTLYGKVRSKYDDWPDCPFSKDKAKALAASVGQEGSSLPPARFFADPKLTEPTAITWDEDGHFYGHLALEGTCHLAFKNKCTTPPMSTVEHRWFHRYPVETDAGAVWAGRVTAGGFHPDLWRSFDATRADYDAKTTAAYVVAGFDEFGIWISGALQPDLPDAVMSILERQKISGDWRETPDGLELVEVLALQNGPRELSEPGFPIEYHMTGDRPTALVACIGPVPRETSADAVGSELAIDYDKLGRSVASAIREQEQLDARRAELAAAIAADEKAERDAARARLAELVEV